MYAAFSIGSLHLLYMPCVLLTPIPKAMIFGMGVGSPRSAPGTCRIGERWACVIQRLTRQVLIYANKAKNVAL